MESFVGYLDMYQGAEVTRRGKIACMIPMRIWEGLAQPQT